MGVQRIVVICQAVRNHFYLFEFRGKAAQRLYKTGIAVYLNVQFGYNLVVRRAVLVEILVFLAYLFQSIAHIKGIVLFLGIQH